MNKTIYNIGLIGLLVIPTYVLPTSDFEQIEERINKEINAGVIPSLVVAVAKNGKIFFEKAYGWADLENAVKATTIVMDELKKNPLKKWKRPPYPKR